MTQIRKNLMIDIVALMIYLLVANPSITGIAVHEWLSMGIIVIFLVHCVVHFDWIVDAARTMPKHFALARQGNLIVDLLLLIVFMVATVSGLGISGTVLPSLGLFADGYYFWGPLHSISAKILLALFVIHIVVHWRWILTLAKNETNTHDQESDQTNG